MPEYRARCTSATLAETKKGDPQIEASFVITEEGELFGKRFAWFGFFTEKTKERTIQSLRYCGWRGVDLTNITDVETQEVSLVIEEEEYEGKTRLRVQWVNSIEGVQVAKPMAAERAKAFAASMKGLAATIAPPPSSKRPIPSTAPASRPASAAAPKPAASKPAPPPDAEREPGDDDDDEIPF